MTAKRLLPALPKHALASFAGCIVMVFINPAAQINTADRNPFAGLEHIVIAGARVAVPVPKIASASKAPACRPGRFGPLLFALRIVSREPGTDPAADPHS